MVTVPRTVCAECLSDPVIPLGGPPPRRARTRSIWARSDDVPDRRAHARPRVAVTADLEAAPLPGGCAPRMMKVMAPKFRTPASARPPAATPERLYDELPPRRGRPDALWAHQADILRSYHGQHLNTSDVALELPTGAGKTLPGLLITEWRRQQYGGRVVYACPTRNLARQTAQAAERVGLGFVTLVGSHWDWSTADKVRYESAEAVAVTTYSTLFNARPALAAPDTALFDDAHAAESFVAGSWSVAIDRRQESTLYRQVLDLLRPALPGLVVERLLDDDTAPGRSNVHLVDVGHVRRIASDLAGILRAAGGEHYWRGEALGAQLDRCLIYASWTAILIRPVVPPTATHPHFTSAKQRIYLSATLGAGGELERAFGRFPIARLAIPEGWDSRGAGRRLFVFPELQAERPPRELASEVIARTGKALVLTASDRDAKRSHDLAPAHVPMLGPSREIDELLASFRDQASGMLALANRYDGLDLPDDTCRVTVLDGIPQGAHLQEQFFSETLQAGRVLRERQRTRIVQGAGRCTRGLSDHSVVVVLGDALTRFLTRPEVREALRPDLQAEIEFGRENSAVPFSDLQEVIDSFLAQDEDWQTQAEPALLNVRRTATVADPPQNTELAEAARHEVQATAALWSGDWTTASSKALDAAGALRSPDLAGYRALWTYLAAGWLGQHAEDVDDDAMRHSSTGLLRKAYAAARSTHWLREVRTLPSGERVLDELDEAAVAAATENGLRTLSPKRWAAHYAETLEALHQTSAARYEQGLVSLGTMLGAHADKPAGDGRCDCALIWPGWWVAIEAKSEQKPQNLISQATVRQANTHLDTLVLDRGVAAPPDSAVLVVSPRAMPEPTAAAMARPFLFMTTPDVVHRLAQDAAGAWTAIRSQAHDLDEQHLHDLVRREFAERSLLPSDIRTRLLSDPVRG